jgi:hypothetical protein
MPETRTPSPLTRISYAENARIIEAAILAATSHHIPVTIHRVTLGGYTTNRRSTEPAHVSALIGEGAKPVTDSHVIGQLEQVPVAQFSEALGAEFTNVLRIPVTCSIKRIAFKTLRDRGGGQIEFVVEPTEPLS